jgi:hypothetical protein
MKLIKEKQKMEDNNFVCKNGCEGNEQSEEFLEYCECCCPEYDSETCEYCGSDDSEWDFDQISYVCNECGNLV